MDYYFRTEKMSVGYRNVPVIENIEIGIQKGEILTLIGPNGAGKSTILKSIARQLAMLGGTAYLGKESITQMPKEELARKMAVVLTERLRTEMMTCRDVVASGRYPYTGRFGILSAEDNRIVEEAMEMTSTQELRDLDFAHISDGQKQRIMLARCLCQEPEILVLDEPTSYLDVRYKLEFLSLLQKLKSERKLTIIMSLHELELAERVSDRIVCVNGAYVDRFGTPEEIFARGYLSGLFGISAGSFDEESTGMELQAPEGKPQVFVIAGAGSGRPVYRHLQRAGIPFATGILYTNDLDYPVAKLLAAEVVETAAFEPMPEEAFWQARTMLESCGQVICSKTQFGTLDAANRRLYEWALQNQKDVKLWQK